jgi:hypothetical protein
MRRRLQLAALALLMLSAAGAEIFSIGAVLPFLGVIAAPDQLLQAGPRDAPVKSTAAAAAWRAAVEPGARNVRPTISEHPQAGAWGERHRARRGAPHQQHDEAL